MISVVFRSAQGAIGFLIFSFSVSFLATSSSHFFRFLASIIPFKCDAGLALWHDFALHLTSVLCLGLEGEVTSVVDDAAVVVDIFASVEILNCGCCLNNWFVDLSELCDEDILTVFCGSFKIVFSSSKA